MKKIYNLLFIFALVLVGGLIGANSVNATNDFEISAYNGRNNISLYWNKFDGADSYDINISEDGFNFEYFDSVSEEFNGYTLEASEIERDKDYYLKVIVLDENGDEIAVSNIVQSHIPTKLNLNVQINGKEAKLNWDKRDSVDYYEVYYCEEDKAGPDSDGNRYCEGTDGDSKEEKTSNNTYTFTNLKPNTSYLFSVNAYNDGEYPDNWITGSDWIQKITGTDVISTKNISSTTATPINNKTYNGKAQKPGFTIKDGTTILKLNKDYKITGYKNNINVGTATIIIQGLGDYTGTKNITFKIVKAKNTGKIVVKNKTLKYKKVKKKKLVIEPFIITKPQGKVTYTKVKGNKKFKINKSTGKITVKKKTKKGTYYLTFKVSIAGNKNFKAKTKTVTMKVVIK